MRVLRPTRYGKNGAAQGRWQAPFWQSRFRLPTFIPVRIAGQGALQEPRMGWSVNIGSIAGTAIRIHFTFVIFLAWIFLANLFSGGAAAAWNGLAFMLLLFACVLAHEFGH